MNDIIKEQSLITMLENNGIHHFFIYCNAALKILETQLSLLKDEFDILQFYNPIDHIKYRLKTIDSIICKANKKHIPISVEDIEKNITDIVGARIICPFLSDVFNVVEAIKKNGRLQIIEEQDYISEPKKCGYISYHMIVLIPVNLCIGYKEIKAEIQIRTLGMDFWATLEHRLSYKIPNPIPDEVVEKLQEYSMKIFDIDQSMGELAKLLISNIE
ncbi:MAG: GTP pyrophosphokinase family protein [Clostridia bacterium]|nr:GTP pyrophosphokinase family protein [Clostridia bacterium]